MFKKLFNRNNVMEIQVPVSGNLLPLTEVPDPVFSGKMMGDGFCIDPVEGKVYAPIAGEVILVFPTKHCVGIRDEQGYEWLIHFGMDSVKLNGEGFTVHVAESEQVEPGDLLFEVDIDAIRPLIPSLMTPVLITNLDGKPVTLSELGNVESKSVYTFEIGK